MMHLPWCQTGSQPKQIKLNEPVDETVRYIQGVYSFRVVVIGHFSLDGELKDEQYCIPPMHNIFLSRCEEDLLKNIISKLSHDGQVVLDAVSENGMLLVNTFVAAVCIYHIQCVLSVFKRKI